jgi:ribonuclease HII
MPYGGVTRMVVLMGVDEAGFGPILGPLVVSSSIFSLPHNLLTSDLWQILSKSVSDRRKRLAGRLLITDSKKAYSRASGIRHLERTVLTVLKCLGKEPATLTELLELLSPNCLERLSGYPWYQDIGDYSLSIDTADKEIASIVLADDMASNGIEMLDLKSCCLDVVYYNKMVAAVKNKANVLFSATCSLIKSAYDNFADDDLQIIVDRQGGRIHYRKNLQRMFGDMELKILRESSATSSYELQAGGKAMRVHFVVGADGRFLPVSLASMVSKYLRELLIGSINSYFAGLSADLKPTAGYWKDGLRFIEEIKTNLPHVQFNNDQLIRSR